MIEPFPMFPLSNVLFPHASMPLHVFEERYRAMMEVCTAGDGRFGVVLISRGSEVGGGDTRELVGTVAHLERADRLADGRWLVLVEGRERLHVNRWLEDDPYPRALVEEIAEAPTVGDLSGPIEAAASALTRARALLSELGGPNLTSAPSADDPERLCWWLCEQAPVTAFDRQRLLGCKGLSERLGLVTEMANAAADDAVRLLGGG